MFRPFCMSEVQRLRIVGRSGGGAGVGEVSPNERFALELAARADAIMVVHVEPSAPIDGGGVVRVPVKFPCEGVVIEIDYAERLTGQFWHQDVQIWTPTNDDASIGFDQNGHASWLNCAGMFGSVVRAGRSVSRPRKCAYHVRDENDTWTIGFRNNRLRGYYVKPQLELHFIPLRGNGYDSRFRRFIAH